MEKVLDVYKRPYNPQFPVVCMDESPKQLNKEIRKPIQASLGQPTRHDYEYERCGVCNIFMANEPLAGKRLVQITEKKTKTQCSHFIEEIAENYPDAEKIILVMDNLNTYNPGALYEAFNPEKAKKLWDRVELVYTPKNGSWLNIAEIELNVLNRQCLNRRIDDISLVKSEVEAWQNHRNNKDARINWQFTTKKARVKLKRLYPTYDA